MLTACLWPVEPQWMRILPIRLHTPKLVNAGDFDGHDKLLTVRRKAQVVKVVKVPWQIPDFSEILSVRVNRIERLRVDESD